MFNQYSFNQTPFNVPVTTETYAQAEATAQTYAEATVSVEYAVSGVASATTEACATPVVEKFASGVAEAQTSATAAPIRERFAKAEASAETYAEATAIVHIIQKMQYTGTLAPGARLVIDTNRFTAVMNGQTNVLDKVSGDFISLAAGENIISLSAPGQTLLRIDYRDKSI